MLHPLHNLRKNIIEPALDKFSKSLSTRLEKVSIASAELAVLFMKPKTANFEQILEMYGDFMPGKSNAE